MVKNFDLRKYHDCVLQIDAYKNSKLLRKGSGVLVLNNNNKINIWTNYHIFINNYIRADRFLVRNEHFSSFMSPRDIIAFDPQKDILIINFENKIKNNFNLKKSESLSNNDELFVLDQYGNIHDCSFIKYIFILHKNITSICLKVNVKKGNSGNPVLNKNGKVVAVISAGSYENEYNIAYAIPVKDYLNSYVDKYDNESGQKNLSDFEKGKASFAKGNHIKAVHYFQNYRKNYPHDEKVYYSIGNVLYNLGLITNKKENYDNALKYYYRGLVINPSGEQTNFNLGNLYNELDNLNKAVEFYSKVIKLNPYNVKAFLNRGNVFVKQKNNNRALLDYNKAIHINPEYKDAYNNRGNLYFDFKMYSDSLRDYNKVLSMDKKDAEAYCNRGNYYHYFNKYEDALRDYNKSIRYKKDFFQSYIRRGVLFQETGKLDNAIMDFSKAISIIKNFALPYINRGECFFIQKKYYKALLDWKIAASLSFHNKPVLFKKIKLAENYLNNKVEN